jgi:hypothetical protein
MVELNTPVVVGDLSEIEDLEKVDDEAWPSYSLSFVKCMECFSLGHSVGSVFILELSLYVAWIAYAWSCQDVEIVLNAKS